MGPHEHVRQMNVCSYQKKYLNISDTLYLEDSALCTDIYLLYLSGDWNPPLTYGIYFWYQRQSVRPGVYRVQNIFLATIWLSKEKYLQTKFIGWKHHFHLSFIFGTNAIPIALFVFGNNLQEQMLDLSMRVENSETQYPPLPVFEKYRFWKYSDGKISQTLKDIDLF